MASTGPDAAMTVNAVLKLVFYSVVIVLGVFGNGLIFRVYWAKPQRTSTHVLIMGLAWVDFLVCAMRFYSLVKFGFLLREGSFVPGPGLRAVLVANLVNVFASVGVTAAIAAERYDCVCRPPRQRRLLGPGPGRARGLLVASYAVAAVVISPIAVDFYWPSLTAKKLSGALQMVLLVAATLVICACYGRVFAVIRRHVRVNALSGVGRDGPSTVTGGLRGYASTVDREFSTTLPPISHPGQASTAAGPSQPSAAAARASSVRGSSEAATGEAPGPPGANEARPKETAKSAQPLSLQRKTTRMLFITTVVFMLSWLTR